MVICFYSHMTIKINNKGEIKYGIHYRYKYK